jgi:hypothetical protein
MKAGNLITTNLFLSYGSKVPAIDFGMGVLDLVTDYQRISAVTLHPTIKCPESGTKVPSEEAVDASN